VSAYVRASHVRQLLQLIAEAKHVRSSSQAHARRLLEGLARIVDARAGSSLTDHHFEPHAPSRLSDQIGFGWRSRRAHKALTTVGTVAHPLVIAMQREVSQGAGASLTVLREDLVADNAWYESPWVRHTLAPREPIDSSLMSIIRLDAGSRVHAISLYRSADAPRFDDADAQLVELFHQEYAHSLSNLDAEQRALSAREQQTLELLLEGRSDKEIASELGISRYTVNQYNKAIFHKAGVHSRSELLARWSRGRSPF
jgi:DNA-binding CsgD family transcriptional regulator